MGEHHDPNPFVMQYCHLGLATASGEPTAAHVEVVHQLSEYELL